MSLEPRVGCGPGAPGWMWAPKIPVLCFSKHLSNEWLFSSSEFCVSCSLLRRIFDLFWLMMIPCLEQSSIRDSIMAISPPIELDVMCRSSLNLQRWPALRVGR